MAIAKPYAPARKQAGYTHEGRLRGLSEAAQASLAYVACPVTG